MQELTELSVSGFASGCTQWMHPADLTVEGAFTAIGIFF